MGGRVFNLVVNVPPPPPLFFYLYDINLTPAPSKATDQRMGRRANGLQLFLVSGLLLLLLLAPVAGFTAVAVGLSASSSSVAEGRARCRTRTHAQLEVRLNGVCTCPILPLDWSSVAAVSVFGYTCHYLDTGPVE